MFILKRTENYVLEDDDFNYGAGFAQTARDVIVNGEGTFANEGVVMAVSAYVVFANYTSVTVKAQATLDGTNWEDIPSATTSTSATIISFPLVHFTGSVSVDNSEGPWIQWRLHVTGTLSGSTDTLVVDIVEQIGG